MNGGEKSIIKSRSCQDDERRRIEKGRNMIRWIKAFGSGDKTDGNM